MDLKETGLDCVGWICLAQDRGQGHAVVNFGADLLFHKVDGILTS